VASAILNLRVTPRRMLPAREAAEYIGISAKKLAVVCPVAPIEMPDGSRLYDMRDLDAWIDGLKSGDPTGDEEILGRLG
jgi:hypothetical protein